MYNNRMVDIEENEDMHLSVMEVSELSLVSTKWLEKLYDPLHTVKSLQSYCSQPSSVQLLPRSIVLWGNFVHPYNYTYLQVATAHNWLRVVQ